MSGKGDVRERMVRAYLEQRGWWVARAAGSLGDADLVAAKRLRSVERHLWLIEVKANRDGGPFKNFGPEDRAELLAAAKLAGAEAWLCYWPPHGAMTWIHSSRWPGVKTHTRQRKAPEGEFERVLEAAA